MWLLLGVPVIAMAICGLWHGAAMHYLYWGIWHGFGLCVYQLWAGYKKKHKRVNRKSTIGALASGQIGTFVFVTLGWVMFQTPRILETLRSLTSGIDLPVSSISLRGVAYLSLGLITAFVLVPVRNKVYPVLSRRWTLIVDYSVFMVLVEGIMSFTATSSGFMYAGF